MAQDTVIKGKDNPVIFQFSFTGDFSTLQLNSFSRIALTIGEESYSTDITPDNLFIVNDTELRLKIGDTTELEPGRYNFELVGYSASYDDGYLLHGAKKPILSSIKVI